MEKSNYKLITLLAFCLFLPIGMFAQTSKKLDLTLKEKTLKEFFRTIESKTEYTFMYNNIDLDQKVSIEVNQTSLDYILKTVLTPMSLTYEVRDRQILIKNLIGPVQSMPTDNQSSKSVSGTILDDRGDPVIGANIIEKGTTNGTVTDINGGFSLKIEEDAVLYISYIGYLDQEINTTGRTSINIILQEDTKTLEELVVVGYGIQKKVNVVGSIATVDGKELDGRAQSSVISSLTGKMPGVTITQAGGRPGEQTGTIRVRGIGSFGAEPSALILIDGIPGNLSDVNPNDIANISVLKDASSAAIYGARAANGVVLVTTKMGNEGKVVVTYNGYAGVNKPTALPEMVNTWEYAEALNRADGITRFTEAEMQAMRDGSMPQGKRMKNLKSEWLSTFLEFPC